MQEAIYWQQKKKNYNLTPNGTPTIQKRSYNTKAPIQTPLSTTPDLIRHRKTSVGHQYRSLNVSHCKLKVISRLCYSGIGPSVILFGPVILRTIGVRGQIWISKLPFKTDSLVWPTFEFKTMVSVCQTLHMMGKNCSQENHLLQSCRHQSAQKKLV